MTCILGLDTEGAVYLAADRRTTCGGCEILTDEAEKIARCGPWLIASNGSASIADLVEANRESLASAESPRAIARLLATYLKDFGWEAQKSGAGPGDYGFSALVASVSGLWFIAGDLSTTKIPRNRPCGRGSGGDLAMGAAAAFLDGGRSPADAVARAVEVAIRYDEGCGGEVDFRSIDKAPAERAGAARATQSVGDGLLTSELLMAPEVA